ncbi:MAG: phosphatase PAP2 family protein [Gemmatimonadaceae bacterium]
MELTVSLLVAGGGIWLFSALLDAVLDNATMVRLDRATDAWIHAHVTSSGLTFFQHVSQAGSPVSMTILAVAGGGLLWWYRRTPMLVTWSAAFAGSGILAAVVKVAVKRGRPTYGAAYLTHASYSFPSGHSSGSFIGIAMTLFVISTYGILKGAWFGVATVLGAAFVILVGVSRVYLGVHYPSDVIGGYAVSAAWGAICIGVAGIVLHARGRSLSS